MAVGYVGQWNATIGSLATSLDVSVTPSAGSDKLLVAFVSYTTTLRELTVTYDPGGGDEAVMTEIADQQGSGVRHIVCILKDTDIVSSTTKTIRVTSDGNTRISICVAELTGVDQTTPHDTVQSFIEESNVTSASHTVDTVTGDLAMDFIHSIRDHAITGSQTSVNIYNTANPRYGVSRYAGNGTLTFSWSLSIATTYVWFGLNFNQAAGGGTTVPIFAHHYRQMARR